MDLNARIESHAGADAGVAQRAFLEAAQDLHARRVRGYGRLLQRHPGSTPLLVMECRHRWALRLLEQELAAP